MKKQLLIALWACLALSISKAQETKDEKSSSATTKYKDTLLITPSSDVKILILGNFENDLSNLEDVDTLKQFLINDVLNARKQVGYPMDSKLTHYFVAESGKRRLKTESDDYQEPEINVAKEKRAIRLDLYSHEYIIYAMKNNYECHIYLKDANNLENLSRINLTEPLNAAKADRWIVRQNTRINLNLENEKWAVKDHKGSKQDMLELSPSFGMTLLGSRWSPTIAFNLSILLTNKYGHGYLKTGLSYDLNSFADWKDNEIWNISLLHSFSFNIMTNLSDTKQRWFGLEAGILKSKPGRSPFNNDYKFGFITEGFGSFNYSFDVILMGNKQHIYSLGLKLPF